jgi:hypothetical protein
MYNPNKNRRKDMVAAGAYDGRFREKVVRDKKKHEKKNWARIKTISYL